MFYDRGNPKYQGGCDTHFHTVLCLSFHCSHRQPDRKGSSHTVQPKRDIVYHISKHTPDTCDRPLQFHSPKIQLVKNPNDSYVMWEQLTTDMVNTLPPFHLLRHARGYSKTLYLTSKAYIVFDRFFFFLERSPLTCSGKTGVTWALARSV